ncbi:MAG: diphthine--ammonia ligase [Candidatus Marsarchaeota archaeon]
MRIAALVSGGKDSWTAVNMAMEEGHSVAVVVNARSPNNWSYMYHTVNSWLVEVQATAARLPFESFYTRGEKEVEVEDLAHYLAGVKERWHVDALSIGGIRSNYQGDRIKMVCDRLGLEVYAPLWHKDSEWLLEEYLRRGMDIVFVLASALGLGPSWLGRHLDESAISELVALNKKWGVDPTGEGGEYESMVLDSPIFKERIAVEDAEKVWKVDTGVYLIKRVKLVPKQVVQEAQAR